MPRRRSRRASAEPRIARFWTISLTRSPATAQECTGCSAAFAACCTLASVFEELLGSWDGEEAVIRFDRESGAWMFVCVHSTARGPACGGTRLRVYPTPADGLADAMRLSQAMTVKMAVANADRGGGKAVLAVPALPEGEERRALLLRYAQVVTVLGGTYRTAGDMNITPADLDIVAEVCPWVYGTTGAGGNSGRGTAIGVLHAIRASVEHRFGSPELAGRRVLVQGVGSVGHTSRPCSQPTAPTCSSQTSTALGPRRSRRRSAARRSRPRARSRPSATSIRRARSAAR